MNILAPRADPLVLFVGRMRQSQRARTPPWRAFSFGLGSAIAVCLIVQILRLAVFDNWHEVQSGRVFRSSQMSGARLQTAIQKHQIRTIVNLRGPCTDFPWYQDECHTTHGLNVAQEDIVLSAIRLPPPAEMRRLVETLDRVEYPILLHCRQGVDRTGLAAAVVRLLERGTTLSEARLQLSLAYGYIPYNGTENVIRFLDLYQEWLQVQKLAHSPELFRYWATERYCPGACRARLQLCLSQLAPPIEVNHAITITLRAHNESIRLWQFRPGTWHGIHARYQITGKDGQVVFQERAGQFDAMVQPGEHIDLQLIIPRLPVGKYSLFADMVDVDQNAFSQYGVEPIFWDFEVVAK
jgi:protein tyrosine/serine phosphatase